MEGLAKETLHLTGTAYNQFVFVAQLIQSKNRNNILQLFIALQHHFNPVCSIVMKITNDDRRKDTTGTIQWIHGRVNTKVSNFAAQYRSGIKVRKGCRRRRIS